MSQYMPNTAISSAPERMPSGSAHHGGSPATRSENSPSLLEQLDPPAAVPEHQVEHRRRHDHRPDRAADHLPDLAPARGRRAGSSLRQNVIVSCVHEMVLFRRSWRVNAQ